MQPEYVAEALDVPLLADKDFIKDCVNALTFLDCLEIIFNFLCYLHIKGEGILGVCLNLKDFLNEIVNSNKVVSF